MSTSLTIREDHIEEQPTRAMTPAESDFAMQQRIAKIFSASGYFQDARDLAQAFVKIQAGKELGIPPMAAMSGISVIDGKPSIGANLIACCMKRHGYTWKVKRLDTKGCELEIFMGGQSQGVCSFTEEDAKRAEVLNKKNWTRYPKSMYFARTISQAAKLFAPEIFGGVTVYTAEELGAENTNEDGIIETTREIPDGGSREAQRAVLAQKIAEMERAGVAKPVEYVTPIEDAEPETTKNYDFLKKCKEAKTALGDERYYRVLGAHGFEKANMITKRGDQIRVYRALMDEANSSLETVLQESIDQLQPQD